MFTLYLSEDWRTPLHETLCNGLKVKNLLLDGILWSTIFLPIDSFGQFYLDETYQMLFIVYPPKKKLKSWLFIISHFYKTNEMGRVGGCC